MIHTSSDLWCVTALNSVLLQRTCRILGRLRTLWRSWLRFWMMTSASEISWRLWSAHRALASKLKSVWWVLKLTGRDRSTEPFWASKINWTLMLWALYNLKRWCSHHFRLKSSHFKVCCNTSPLLTFQPIREWKAHPYKSDLAQRHTVFKTLMFRVCHFHTLLNW